jgi:hypothetical protein
MLGELVAKLRRSGELDIDDHTAALLAGMSAATIDRLAPLCAIDAASILDEAVHPVRELSALQFAVHQRAWRTDE